ncbi:MAG TPA: response regulator [Dissulfurispiraceae bacterium]|nr:response regulator [Dissulfurispiraceae bacterium]
MRRTKVLLVDDEVEFASALAERLHYRNYNATAVFNANDAVQVARKEFPDVMVVDLKLPGGSGLEIVEAIRQFDPEVAVILLSGHGSITSKELLESGSITDYAVKPIDIEELVEKIDRAKQIHDAQVIKEGKDHV